MAAFKLFDNAHKPDKRVLQQTLSLGFDAGSGVSCKFWLIIAEPLCPLKRVFAGAYKCLFSESFAMA